MGNNYKLDRILMVFAGLNACQLLVEVAFFQFYRNKGVNLEIKLKPQLTQRLKCYLCTGMLSMALGGILVLVVLKA